MVSTATSTTAAVRIVDLVKSFKGFRAIDGVNLTIATGTTHALLGPNGAGKTTLFNMLSGLIKPTEGQIFYGEEQVAGHRPEAITRLGVGRSFQIVRLFNGFTCREHIELAMMPTTGLGRNVVRRPVALRELGSRIDAVLEMVGLSDQADSDVRGLPYGKKRALEIAVALADDPRVLLLDEPTAGMGAEDVDRIVALVDRIRENRTVVLVEHNMKIVSTLAERVTVLQQGRVLAEGTYGEIRTNPDVIESYLGGGQRA